VLIFLDLETTGLEDDDKVCSIGIIAVDKEITTIYELVNDGKKIPPKASSINHITNEMIKGKQKLIKSNGYKFLKEHNNSNTVIVGHNIGFDMKKLLAIGFNFKGLVVDTLRVSKHLIPECDAYSLQILRYDLKLYKKEIKELEKCGIEGGILPHNALSDALIVKLLYEYLLEMSSLDEMLELSFKNVLLQKLEFGKYTGRYIEEIVMIDRGYLEWMLSSITDLNDDLRYSISYYLD
jgi:DNA polymerase-3 subunit epsilon/exodeoxyribonuclease X